MSPNSTVKSQSGLLLWLGLFLFFGFSALSIFFQPAAAASPPLVISYQGKLLNGGLAATTTLSMAFELYDALTGGNILYTASGTLAATNTISVTPSSGVFAVNLGASGTNSIDNGTVFKNNQSVYLQVVVNGTGLQPRRQLTSAPYAINSQYLDGIAASTTLSSQYIPYSDAYGNFSFQGTPQSAAVGGGVLYINPTSTERVNRTLLGLAVGGTEKFRVNTDGDTSVAGDLSITGTSTFVGGLSNLTQLGTIDVQTGGVFGITEMFQVGTLLYASVEDDGFAIVDVTEPRSPQVLSVTDEINDTAEDIVITGNLAHIAYDAAGYAIYDITNPRVPVLLSNLVTGDNIEGVAVAGQYAYLAAGTTGLLVIDISDPNNPVQVGNANPTFGVANEISISGNYAYVAAGTTNILQIFDVFDPANPKLVGELSGSDYSHDVYVDGNFAYVADQGNGTRIIDITDVTNPRIVATYDGTLGTALSLHKLGDYVYVADNDEGMYVIDVSSSTNPVLVDADDQGNWYNAVYAANNLVYAGDLTGNLRIYGASGAVISNAKIGALRTTDLTVGAQASFESSLFVRNGVTIGNNGLWVGGDFAMFASTSTINATNTLSFSNTALFRASSTENPAFIFDTRNEVTSSTDKYIFSIRTNATPRVSVSSNGDLKVYGKVFASSTIVGTPGNPGDLAERVDIAEGETVEPGDVVIIDPNSRDTYRKSTTAYEQSVAGVISTNPIIVVGFGKTEHTAVMALTGRVPIKVSSENGAIQRGDLLVTATEPGYAMKYDPTQDDGGRIVGIIGMALDTFDDEGTGSIMGLVRTGWVNNRQQTIASLQQNLIRLAQNGGGAPSTRDLNVEQLPSGALKVLSENLSLNGYYITNVGGIFGANDAWEIDGRGRFVTKVQTISGKKSLYAIQSEQTEIILSGSAQLDTGVARVVFASDIQEVIDPTQKMHITVTLTDPATGIYVSEKSPAGFTVEELQEGESDARFDWVVIAQRRDSVFDPIVLPVPIVPQEQVPIIPQEAEEEVIVPVQEPQQEDQEEAGPLDIVPPEPLILPEPAVDVPDPAPADIIVPQQGEPQIAPPAAEPVADVQQGPALPPEPPDQEPQQEQPVAPAAQPQNQE